MTDKNTRVSALLHEAGETHHRVYRIVDGADDDWASWYADWLIKLSELPELLGTTPVRSELVYMLADHEITRDELYAVGATFTLVAWAFAYSYTVCQAIEPGSFTAAVDPSGERTWMELLFLSFTTLTSTGLSDVTPIKPFARALVMLEQVGGLAYVAMLVSRLVGLTIFRRHDVN